MPKSNISLPKTRTRKSVLKPRMALVEAQPDQVKCIIHYRCMAGHKVGDITLYEASILPDVEIMTCSCDQPVTVSMTFIHGPVPPEIGAATPPCPTCASFGQHVREQPRKKNR